MSKKIVSLVVGVAAVFAFASVASAATVQELQAMIAQLQAQLAALSGGTTSATTAYTFTKNLTVGSRGADVEALQQVLIDGGYLTAVTAPTGYFGAATKAALAKWQAANGVTPASGYFGPLTRAAINATVTTGGTTGGTTTGTSTTPVTSTPSEGSFTVKLAATPANTQNITNTNDVPVYGVEVKAQNSDITVDRMDLKFTVTDSSSNSYAPYTFVTGVSVVDSSTGSTVYSKSLGVNDWTLDSSNNYWTRLSGLGFKVAKDTTKTLVVRVNVTPSFDLARTLTVVGYGSNSMRGTDTMGINNYADLTGLTRTHSFSTPGTSSMTVSVSPENPSATNVYVSTTEGAKGVEMLRFTAKSSTGGSTITTVNLTSSSTGQQPTAIYLYKGSDLVSSVSGATTTSFTDLSVNIAENETATFVVKADFSKDQNTGSVASTTLNSVTYRKPNGSTATVSTTVSGNNMSLYSSAAAWTLVGATTPTVVTDPNSGTTSSMTGSITLKVKALGSQLTEPTAANFTVKAATSTGATPVNVTVLGFTITPDNANNIIGEGGEATITLTPTLRNADVTYDGSYYFYVSSIAWTPVGGSAVTQTSGLENFKTASQYFDK